MLYTYFPAFLAVPLAIATALVFGTICRKAGYSAWWGVLMLVPLVNLIWLIYFASSLWPIHRELAFRRMDQNDIQPQDNKTLITAAGQLENQGRWDEAVRVYDAIAAHPELPSAVYAGNCANRLRERLASQPGTS